MATIMESSRSQSRALELDAQEGIGEQQAPLLQQRHVVVPDRLGEGAALAEPWPPEVIDVLRRDLAHRPALRDLPVGPRQGLQPDGAHPRLLDAAAANRHAVAFHET